MPNILEEIWDELVSPFDGEPEAKPKKAKKPEVENADDTEEPKPAAKPKPAVKRARTTADEDDELEELFEEPKPRGPRKARPVPDALKEKHGEKPKPKPEPKSDDDGDDDSDE